MTFVDTSAFYALTDTADANHRRARAALTRLAKRREPLISTSDVLDESVTLVRYRLGHGAAVKLGQSLLDSSWCRLIEVTSEVRRAAWEIFVRYSDQSFSFTDCSSFAVMRARGLTEAFTFDQRDFAAAGFVVVPVR